MTENDKQLYQLTQGVTRIANYIEEILRLVKADQAKTAERYKEYDKEQESHDNNTSYKTYE